MTPPEPTLMVDVAAATVTVGGGRSLLTPTVLLGDVTWADRPVTGDLMAQCSAHGRPVAARFEVGDGGQAAVWFEQAHPRVAPGQSVVLYEGDEVLGGGIAV